jgi:hypothetical protein
MCSCHSRDYQEKSASKTPRTVTGCLQKGDQPDEFSITSEGGTSWELRSSTVRLADHVGHQVTGSLTREAKAEGKKKAQVENAAETKELGELRVTSLKIVSQSCTK